MVSCNQAGLGALQQGGFSPGFFVRLRRPAAEPHNITDVCQRASSTAAQRQCGVQVFTPSLQGLQGVTAPLSLSRKKGCRKCKRDDRKMRRRSFLNQLLPLLKVGASWKGCLSLLSPSVLL